MANATSKASGNLTRQRTKTPTPTTTQTKSGQLPPRRARASLPLLSELTFVRCDPVPVNYNQYVYLRDRKRRFELWDGRTATAWELRDGPTALHEWPIQALKEMMVLMGAVRGLPVPCFGSRGLAVLDGDGKRLRVLHPDQSVYLKAPARTDSEGDIPVHRSGFPNIVMEVDNTTDTRKGKLKLYEDMGVPELWVEVPEIWLESTNDKPPIRPPDLVPGLTIFLLEGSKYNEYPASRALLGWQADDIHKALNDLSGISAHHSAVLEELGRRIGARTGTGPDDHPLMRSLRQQSRREGLTRGLAQGRVEGQAQVVRQLLERRGIGISATFPMDIAGFADLGIDSLLDAAAACSSEQDFRARLGRR